MNVDRFSNWCQKAYTSDRGLRIVVVAVRSIRRLLATMARGTGSVAGAACRGAHPLPRPTRDTPGKPDPRAVGGRPFSIVVYVMMVGGLGGGVVLNKHLVRGAIGLAG